MGLEAFTSAKARDPSTLLGMTSEGGAGLTEGGVEMTEGGVGMTILSEKGWLGIEHVDFLSIEGTNRLYHDSFVDSL